MLNDCKNAFNSLRKITFQRLHRQGNVPYNGTERFRFKKNQISFCEALFFQFGSSS